MSITILCAGALARPHAAATDGQRDPGMPLPSALTDGALARTLRRARVVARSRQAALVPEELPDEAWLRERFGVEGTIAACALPRSDSTGIELMVRPVHLHVATDHLVLAPLDAARIGRDEADSLAARANAFLADEALALRVVAPDMWRLEASDAGGNHADIAALGQLSARSARMAEGRSIDVYQPCGTAARRWRQLANLVQMAWFDHPLNAALEAAGRLPINALWFEGRAGTPARRPFTRVAAADAAVAGLARRAGIETWPFDAQRGAAPSMLDASSDEVLLAPDFWRQPVSDGDAAGWEQAWLAFDRWLGAVMAALAQRELRFVLTGERSTLELHRAGADRWKIWRRLRLAELLRETS